MDTVRAGLVVGDGLRLMVREQGDPGLRTVVLVHGFPDNSSVWDGVADLLADRFHVVRYDVRGAGGSEAPADRSGYALDHLAADLAAVVRHVSPREPVHLVGHDWGAVQAWHAVTDPRYAELFASYTTMSGPSVDHAGAWLRDQLSHLRVWPVARQLAHSWYVGAFQVPRLPELVWRSPILRGRLGAEARDAVNGVELYRANMLGGSRPTGRRTSVPVQQLALMDDPYVLPPLLTAAEPFCDQLWRRGLRCGHWAPRTHPEAVAALVAEFADHVEGAPASRELRRARITRESRRLAGQLALVTGAGGGIGRATALALAERGADVLVADIDEDTAALTARDVGELGVAAHPYQVDVADGAALHKLAEQVAADHGVPDIVVANAGIGMAGGFLDTGEDDWRRVIDVNLLGVVHTLRAFAPLLVDRNRRTGQGGHLVTIASIAAVTPWPALTAYAATKAAVLSLTQSLRTELSPHGIGVTAILPGVIATNIARTTRFVGQDTAGEQRSQAAADARFRRRGHSPDVVANAIVRAIAENRAVVPVTPEAHMLAAIARLAPALVRRFGALGRSVR
jgi:NAD(P)-dependent dehydrogenase (short-subunit alcohol dehydrogenase family)/pimeloyl-ACP methyl ester carboxylesterase